MKKNYWILATLLLGACSQSEFIELPEEKNQAQENEVALFDNGIDSPMLRFSSTNSFFKIFDELLDKNSEDQVTWATSLNKEALLANAESCEDSVMLSAPRAFQALFNKQLKVQINDSLLQYNNGTMYLTAIDNKVLKEPVKCGNSESSEVKSANSPQTRQIGEVPFDGHNMNHQYEFRYSRTHKYVHGFRSFVTYINGRQCQILIMDYKLEFYRNGINQARDPRDININLECTVNLGYPIDYVRSPFGTYKNVVGIMEIPVAKITHGVGLNYFAWGVTCTGKITHMIVGQPQTKWEDVWN